MKNTRILTACALALALAATTVRAVEEGKKAGKATIRSIHGKVEYNDNGVWKPAAPNQKFDGSVTLRTGPDGTADVSVNGTSSAIRMTNTTTLQIKEMSYVGTVREGDTTTMLELKSGSVIGNVKKITAASRYEIETPHGVAGIRGTDFAVEAIPTEDGKFVVTFNSITGVITVSAMINGQLVTHTLTTGTSWEIGETPKKMAEAVIQNYQNQILTMIQNIESQVAPGPFGGGGNRNTGPINGNGNGNGNGTTPPFPGGPPQGTPAS